MRIKDNHESAKRLFAEHVAACFPDECKCLEIAKSSQPRSGHSTAEDAKVHRGKTILNNLCEPLRPLRLIRLYQMKGVKILSN